jgi:hypothetical protein
MGSLHSVGPWSLMQAALDGGAATWRPTMPDTGGRLACLCSGSAATGVINERMSGSALKSWIFVMIGSFENQTGRRRKIFQAINFI